LARDGEDGFLRDIHPAFTTRACLMRIVTWNCCGGFINKAQRIAKFTPDILAVQEVEGIGGMSFFSEGTRPTYCHRVGFNPFEKKSIGMSSFTDVKLSFIDSMQGIRRYEAQHKDQKFNVMAVWTTKATHPRKNYRQLHDALGQREVAEWCVLRPTIVLGDFNESAKFKSDGWQKLNKLTNSLGLVSAYHYQSGESFGAETRPTYYHLHKKERPFHIDYCLVPEKWLPKITNVEVGIYEDWHGIRDHVPLTVEFAL